MLLPFEIKTSYSLVGKLSHHAIWSQKSFFLLQFRVSTMTEMGTINAKWKNCVEKKKLCPLVSGMSFSLSSERRKCVLDYVRFSDVLKYKRMKWLLLSTEMPLLPPENKSSLFWVKNKMLCLGVSSHLKSLVCDMGIHIS